MCAQRMFRSGPAGDVVKSSYSHRPDERQSSFDLGPQASDHIQRKARDVAERLASITGTPAIPTRQTLIASTRRLPWSPRRPE
jgi:hypothetical protein